MAANLKTATGNVVLSGKDRLGSVVAMRVALIKATSDYRLHEGNRG